MRSYPKPVERASDLPCYCEDCGRKLVYEDRTESFDPITGAPKLVAYAFCRGSWLERLLGDPSEYHASYVVSGRPPGPPPPPPDRG